MERSAAETRQRLLDTQCNAHLDIGARVVQEEKCPVHVTNAALCLEVLGTNELAERYNISPDPVIPSSMRHKLAFGQTHKNMGADKIRSNGER